MKLLVLKRPDPKHKGCFLWLVANGMNMGRWTSNFGVNCLADLEDNIKYLQYMTETHSDSVIEEYELLKKERQ